ncbi:hypothetical protein LguiA_012668 [Lonicera macranthoides]
MAEQTQQQQLKFHLLSKLSSHSLENNAASLHNHHNTLIQPSTTHTAPLTTTNQPTTALQNSDSSNTFSAPQGTSPIQPCEQNSNNILSPPDAVPIPFQHPSSFPPPKTPHSNQFSLNDGVSADLNQPLFGPRATVVGSKVSSGNQSPTLPPTDHLVPNLALVPLDKQDSHSSVNLDEELLHLLKNQNSIVLSYKDHLTHHDAPCPEVRNASSKSTGDINNLCPISSSTVISVDLVSPVVLSPNSHPSLPSSHISAAYSTVQASLSTSSPNGTVLLPNPSITTDADKAQQTYTNNQSAKDGHKHRNELSTRTKSGANVTSKNHFVAKTVINKAGQPTHINSTPSTTNTPTHFLNHNSSVCNTVITFPTIEVNSSDSTEHSFAFNVQPSSPLQSSIIPTDGRSHANSSPQPDILINVSPGSSDSFVPESLEHTAQLLKLPHDTNAALHGNATSNPSSNSPLPPSSNRFAPLSGKFWGDEAEDQLDTTFNISPMQQNTCVTLMHDNGSSDQSTMQTILSSAHPSEQDSGSGFDLLPHSVVNSKIHAKRF